MNRWSRLSRFAFPYWKGITLSLVLTITGVFLDVLKPWPVTLLVDSVLSGKPLPASASWLYSLPGTGSAKALLVWLTAATILVFLASWARELTQSYVQTGVGGRLAYELGAELFHHMQRLSLRFHGRHSTGDLVRRVTSNAGCVRDLVFGVFLPTFGALLSLGMMLGIMWRLNHMLSLLSLIAAPLLGILVHHFSRPMEERVYRQMQLEGEMADAAEQTLSALPIVRAFGQEAAQHRRFVDLCRETGTAYVRSVLAQLQFKVGASGVTAVATAIVMAVGGTQVVAGKLTLGSLLVFLSYLASLYTPMETLAYLSSAVASAGAGARRVFETLGDEDHVVEHPHARRLVPAVSGQGTHIRIEGITFGYDGARPTLRNIDLEACPGEVVALVGPTGAGKSTLISLIPRLFDPWEGRITINGTDARELQLASLREQIAFVLQDPFLFSMTVAENIAYGRPSAGRDEIVAAAAAANAEEFVRALPDGFDTVIGPRGATLSAGQRQRLSIARALLKDSPILILDEPTSALDAGTESVVLEALERLFEGRTTFVIAHRLSTAKRADRIAVLDHGRIIETGPHDVLMLRDGMYSRFAALQFGQTARKTQERQQSASA